MTKMTDQEKLATLEAVSNEAWLVLKEDTLERIEQAWLALEIIKSAHQIKQGINKGGSF